MKMGIHDAPRLMAGIVTLSGVVLGWLVSPWFYLVTVAAALNLIQSAFAKWCPAMWVLAKLGFR